jgi:cbb3-type cytochrome oxidase maturation protein
MSVIVMLIIAGGLVAGGFLLAFIWAVRAGQFDDTFTPAVRVLLEAPTPPASAGPRLHAGLGCGIRDAGSGIRDANE